MPPNQRLFCTLQRHSMGERRRCSCIACTHLHTSSGIVRPILFGCSCSLGRGNTCLRTSATLLLASYSDSQNLHIFGSGQHTASYTHLPTPCYYWYFPHERYMHQHTSPLPPCSS